MSNAYKKAEFNAWVIKLFKKPQKEKSYIQNTIKV